MLCPENKEACLAESRLAVARDCEFWAQATELGVQHVAAEFLKPCLGLLQKLKTSLRDGADLRVTGGHGAAWTSALYAACA